MIKLQLYARVLAHWVVDFNKLNAILIIFYQYFTISSAINKEIIVMAIVIIIIAIKIMIIILIIIIKTIIIIITIMLTM